MTEAALEIPVDEAPQAEGAPQPTPDAPVVPLDAGVADAGTADQADAPAPETDAEPAADKPEGQWPDDWRERLAKGDEKLQKRLARFASVENVLKSFLEMEKKFSSGEAKRALPDDATPEQAAEWRKENGIPEAPENYKIPEFKGVEWQDGDKEDIGSFVGALHKVNAPQAIVDATLGWYADMVVQRREQQTQQDNQEMDQIETDLMSEWGADYKPNLRLAERAAETYFGDRMLIANSRAPDGRKLGNIPGVMKAMAQLGRETFGDAALIAGDGTSKLQSRKAEIEAVMKTDMAQYHESGMSKEYLGILEAESKITRR